MTNEEILKRVPYDTDARKKGIAAEGIESIEKAEAEIDTVMVELQKIGQQNIPFPIGGMIAALAAVRYTYSTEVRVIIQRLCLEGEKQALKPVEALKEGGMTVTLIPRSRALKQGLEPKPAS